jgi:O-antigen ligase
VFLTVLVAMVFPFIYQGFNPTRFFHLFSYLGSGLIFIYSALLPNLYADYLRHAESKEMVIKYLDIGYLAGIIILIVAFACPRMKLLLKILLIGINGWTLLVSAARGPIVFLCFVLMIQFVVGLVTFMKKSWKLNLKNVFYMTCAVGILGTAGYYLIDKYALLLERSISRMLLLLDPQSVSMDERFTQIYFSFNKIFENAANFSFGLGIGSFGMLYDHVDQRNYPHNVILEIWLELGIVGVILFTLVVFIYFKKIRLHFNSVLIFIYLFLNCLKSYSLVDSRMMFGILSVLLLYNVLLKRKKEVSSPPQVESLPKEKK